MKRKKGQIQFLDIEQSVSNNAITTASINDASSNSTSGNKEEKKRVKYLIARLTDEYIRDVQNAMGV
jgi:hypothetical protein